MALAAAQLGAGAQPRDDRRALAFRRLPRRGARQARRGSGPSARPAVDALGLLPMEVLQSAFWSLDPARTVAKFEAFAALEGAEARTFVTLEDWANDGPPVAAPRRARCSRTCSPADLPGAGALARRRRGDRSRQRSPCPSLNIVSTTDRIVPAATAIRAGERLELALGHVGMVVGSPGAGDAVGAARRLAFPHCSKLLGAQRTPISPFGLSLSKPHPCASCRRATEGPSTGSAAKRRSIQGAATP